MQSSSLPPFLNYPFHYSENRQQASEKVHNNLETISQATFLLVNDRGELVECDFIEWVFEQLKGICGLTNHAKKESVRLRTMQVIAYSAAQGFLTKEDCQGQDSLISRVARNMGLIPDELSKIRDLDELDELIASVVAKILNPKITTPDYQIPIDKYCARHIKDRAFELHNIFARVLLEWLDFLVQDDESRDQIIGIQEKLTKIFDSNPVPQATIPAFIVPTGVTEVTMTPTAKTSSWMKRIGLSLLGTGVLGVAVYTVAKKETILNFLKSRFIQPTPPPQENMSYFPYLIGFAVLSGALAAFMRGGALKKKVSEHLERLEKSSASSSSLEGEKETATAEEKASKPSLWQRVKKRIPKFKRPLTKGSTGSASLEESTEKRSSLVSNVTSGASQFLSHLKKDSTAPKETPKSEESKDTRTDSAGDPDQTKDATKGSTSASGEPEGSRKAESGDKTNLEDGQQASATTERESSKSGVHDESKADPQGSAATSEKPSSEDGVKKEETIESVTKELGMSFELMPKDFVTESDEES